MDEKKSTNPTHRKIITIFQTILPFLVIGFVWEVAARLNLISTVTLSYPTEILKRFFELAFVDGLLWKHFFSSFARLLIGFSIASISGTIVGALLSLNTTLNKMFEPVINLLVSVPTIAWVPVLLVVMGLGDKTVITTVFLGSFFVIVYNTMRGIEIIDKNIINAAYSMGVHSSKLFFKVIIPASFLSILTGLRLGMGYAWRALVGGEMLSAMIKWGIGKMIFQARFWNDAATMIVGILMIGFSVILIDKVVISYVEKRTVIRWGITNQMEESYQE
jgi:NitT/TauT family transport system permease protein